MDGRKPVIVGDEFILRYPQEEEKQKEWIKRRVNVIENEFKKLREMRIPIEEPLLTPETKRMCEKIMEEMCSRKVRRDENENR